MNEQSTRNADTKLKAMIRNNLLLAIGVIFLVIGGMGAWAAAANIAGAVVSSGTIVVRSNVKEVQHRSGGIVKEILVKNGSLVSSGDLLVRLDGTVTRSNLEVVSKQLKDLSAIEKRLLAERDGISEIAWGPGADETLEDVQYGQELLLVARQNSMTGRRKQLEEQIVQFEKRIDGLLAQLQAKTEEISLISDETADFEELLAKQLTPKSRLTALQREKARLQGEHGNLLAQLASTEETISERRIQILQIEESYRAEVLEKLQEVRSRIGKLEEEKIAAQDALTRIEIRASDSGYVHQLAVHTIGGVVAPGETIMKIVPKEDTLVMEARVNPVSISQLTSGQDARVRFPSFDQRSTPDLSATLKSISADLSYDEQTGVGYYLVRLQIAEAELTKLGERSLIPGMPAEVFLNTGERTVLSYLIKPLSDQIAHAFRER